MPDTVRRFAANVVELNNEIVARVTQFGSSTTVSEEMISGSEDTTPGDNAILEKYIPVSVGKTASFGGTVLKDSKGQKDLEDAADDATEDVVVKLRFSDNSGRDYTGFLTNFEVTGELTANLYRYTAQMRVNDKTIVPIPSD